MAWLWREGTADLSTTLRSGRDDKFVVDGADIFPGRGGDLVATEIVISTGA